MRNVLVALVAAGSLAAVSLAAQGPSGETKTGSAGGASTWKVPRTPDGHPDLQGVWANNGVTPMERPKQWKDKPSLTDAELQELKATVARYVSNGGDAVFQNFVQIALDAKDKGGYKQTSYDPTTGNYNQFWMVDRDWDNRTSLITDPPNGLIPPLTPEAEARRERARANRPVVVEGSESGPRGRANGPEDRPLSERCISYGAPRTGAGYDSYFQFVQSPATVVILQELIHDARVVPMDGRPHLPESVRQLHGDSRGHWEGDTLVVETTNYLNGVNGSTPNVRLIERYTRVGPDYINWEITPIDPTTWTRPWTYMIRLKRSNEQLYEYACHEGNYALAGILAGARAEEQAAADAAKKGSR
jgi:hypothetical protein